MPQKFNPLLLVGGGIAAYLLLKPGAAAAVVPSATPTQPAFTADVPVTNAVTQQVLQQIAQSPPNEVYGVNSGIKGANQQFYTCANYQQLLSIDPHLGNPNYQLTLSEANQLLSNYTDLQQEIPTRMGHKSKQTGKTMSTNQDVAQDYWTNGCCAEKRIFYPLIPASNLAYVPPPPSKSIWGTVAQIGTIAAGAVLTVVSVGTAAPFIAAGVSAAVAAESKINGPGDDGYLSDEDVQLIVTGSYILKKILPFYLEVNPLVVNSINNRLDEFLTEVSS